MSNHVKEIHRINYLCSEIDGVYHRASVKMGISDSVSVILYTLLDAGNECMLSDIYKLSGTSKQTINSAIRGLEKEGIVYLEQCDGRSKKVVLTQSGQEYVQQTVARLRLAEIQAYDSWTEEEIHTYITLMEKDLACLNREIEKM